MNPSSGQILFFYCQASGWCVICQTGLSILVLFSDKGVRLNLTPIASSPCHLVVCFLSVCSQGTTGRSLTFMPSGVLHNAAYPLSKPLLSQFLSKEWPCGNARNFKLPDFVNFRAGNQNNSSRITVSSLTAAQHTTAIKYLRNIKENVLLTCDFSMKDFHNRPKIFSVVFPHLN